MKEKLQNKLKKINDKIFNNKNKSLIILKFLFFQRDNLINKLNKIA